MWRQSAPIKVCQPLKIALKCAMNKENKKTVKVGSSPIGHPKEGANSAIVKEDRNSELAPSAPTTFQDGKDHLSLDPLARVQNEEEMDHEVTLCLTGKRWYVSYYILNKGKRQRVREYGRINAEKNLFRRKDLLRDLKKNICLKLHIADKKEEGSKALFPMAVFSLVPKAVKIPDYNFYSYDLNFSVGIYAQANTMRKTKATYLKKNSIKTIDHYIGVFQQWLKETSMANFHPSEFSKAHILEYRTWLMKRSIGNRTINNAVREVRDLFSFMIDNDENLNYKNPAMRIRKLPNRAEKNLAYTADVFQKLIDHLKENDPYLLFYIKIIAFGYIRTDEIRHIKIENIDVNSRKIKLTAVVNKTNSGTFKLIQENILNEFVSRELHQYPGHYYLFSKNNKPGPTMIGENYFRKRFKKVKDKFSIDRNHTLYGFRHTSITQLLESGQQWTKIMDLTDHDSMEAFQRYARTLIGKDPEDMSSKYKVKL